MENISESEECEECEFENVVIEKSIEKTTEDVVIKATNNLYN